MLRAATFLRQSVARPVGARMHSSTTTAPLAVAQRTTAMSQPKFIQWPNTKTCGIVAACQINNWWAPSEQVLVPVETGITWSDKLFQAKDNLSSAESGKLALRLSSLTGMPLAFESTSAFSLSSTPKFHEVLSGNTQFLAEYKGHIIAIHAVFDAGQRFLVSGLPDGNDGYLGPTFVSRQQLLGAQPIPVTVGGASKFHVLPEITVQRVLRPML